MKLERFVAINVPAAAAASRALARLTSRAAVVKLMNAQLIAPDGNYLSLDPEEIVVGICMSISGGLQGAALLCFTEPKALALSEMLVGGAADGSARPTDLDESALKELGNIICGNYVTSLANQMRVKVVPGIPRFARGPFGSMFERVVSGLAPAAKVALLIDVELDLRGGSVLGHLLLSFKTEHVIEI